MKNNKNSVDIFMQLRDTQKEKKIKCFYKTITKITQLTFL